jgi:hypothetical protein
LLKKRYSYLKEYFRPKLAVVIVKKKGNARFFAKMGSTSMANPPPGTIIDHTVTNGKIILSNR